MFTDHQVTYAAMAVAAVMKARKTNDAFKSFYPANFRSDAGHFARYTAEIAGLKGQANLDFVRQVMEKLPAAMEYNR